MGLKFKTLRSLFWILPQNHCFWH